jgi:hypothetical protein
MMKRFFSIIAMAVAGLAAGVVRADAPMSQTLTLKPGWNAVFTSVAPTNSANAIFSSWPVEWVGAYNAESFRSTASTEGGFTGERTVRAPYWSWSRQAGYASTLKSISADTVLVCRSTNDSAVAVTLMGEPAAPRIAWHASNADNSEMLNIVGVRLGGTVKAADYFARSPVKEGSMFYKVSGSGDTPLFVSIASGFGANRVENLNDGDVVFVAGTQVSDWSGPLYVTPRDGIALGEEGALDEIAVRNDGAAEKTVTLTLVRTSNPQLRTPPLKYLDSSEENSSGGWTDWNENVALTCTLSTGETRRVSVAIDRTKLAGNGEKFGGLIAVAESGGTLFRAWLPVSMTDAKPANPWPEGLWLATLRLNAVSYYAKDGDRVDGVAAGGAMTVRVPIVVDAHGVARLVQRATVAGMRVSSAFLPVDLGAVEGTGAFGSGTLAFAYTIGAESPSNPFRHALHPLFDGKQMDFKTPAPSGDDIGNYVGEVKPERFSIGGEVEFAFADVGATPWTPLDTLSGTAKWIYTGVRRDGPVVAEGPFTMQRIARDAVTE